MLHRPTAPTTRRGVPLVLVVLIALVLSACGLTSGDDPVALATPEPNVELLPAETAPQSQAAAVEPTAEADVLGAESGDTAEDADADDTTKSAPAAAEPVDPLSCLSTRARVAQLLLPLATQPELGGARVFAADGELGGIGLLGQPDAGLADALAALQQSSFVPVMVASDEEGGSVQRLATLLGPVQSAAASAQSKTPEDVRKQWVEYGARVRALGIDVIFGPVVDVGAGPGIESRSFSADPDTVATYGRAVAEGLIEGGITPVFKHFPGHGRATADSHLELPTTPPLGELRQVDLVPYVDLLSDPLMQAEAGVMVGHLAVPGLSDQTPTSLSPETINGLLRSEIGFGGLVYTDALNMGAIVNTYGALTALELAFLAGADIAILGSLADLTPALDHLSAKVETDAGFAGVIDNRAARVLAAKGQSSLCAGAE